MEMFKTVTIKNFQSHKHTKIDFVPGTNVIIGESDVGKSAVFRAINWVVSNRPLGEAYRSEWGGDTHVTIETTDGTVVERVKGTARNQYVVNGESLTAFGSGVTTQVTDVLKMSSESIQSQMDPPFLLSATPGEAARMLNRAASIEDIDLTISNLRKSHSQLKTSIKHNETALERYKTEIQQYGDIPVLEERLVKVEQLDAQRSTISQTISDMKRLVQDTQTIQTKLSTTKHIPKLRKRVDGLYTQHQDYRTAVKAQQDKKALVSQIEHVQSHIGVLESVPETLELVNTTQAQYNKMNDMKEDLQDLRILTSRAIRIQEDITGLTKAISDMETELHELAPDICPLCGAQWGEGQ